MNERFKIGEEVQYITNPTSKFIVTYIDKDGLISGIGLDGIAFVDKNPRRWERTGRYFRQAEELMGALKVDPDAIPDLHPLIKNNDEIASMPEEERERKREIVIFQIKDMLFRSNRKRIEEFGAVFENGHDFLELMENILELLES